MAKINYNQEDLSDHHGVAAVIKNAKGHVLMQEHAKYGFWTIPVGKVKDGQSITEGLKQEILEECNIGIQEFKELAVRDYFYDRKDYKIKVISHLFEILKYSGELKNMEPTKHYQQLFLPLEKIMELPYLSDLTLMYLEQLGFVRETRI